MPPRSPHGADLAQHHPQELPALLDRGLHRGSAAGHRAAAADQCLGTELRDPVEGAGRPVLVERVAGVEGGLRLDQVAGEEDLLAG